jgi:Kelch motif
MLGGVRNGRLLLAFVVVLIGTAGCTDEPTSAPGPTGSAAGYRWTTLAKSPLKRTEVAAGVLGGKIWVLGGFADNGAPQTDVIIYDPGADKWSAGPKLPEALHHPAAASDGNRLWVVGGYIAAAQSTPTAAVRYIDSGGTWRDGPPLPAPRAAGALAWDGKRLLFGGGVDPSIAPSADVFALEGDNWRRIGELGVAREHLAAASDGQGNTWFLAGRLGPLDTNRSDVDLVTGDKITRLGQIATARGGVAGFYLPAFGGCVAGGEQNSGTFNNIECIRLDGSTTTLAPMITSRHGLAAVTIGDAAYTLLGGTTPGLSVSDAIEVLRTG